MTRRTFDLADILSPFDDPRLIDGIFNYCTRRCEQCAFTNRCRLYPDLQEQEQLHPEWGVLERVHHSFQKTFDLLRDWCERERIDFAELQADAESEDIRTELRKVEETRSDPLQRLAETYTHGALKVAQTLQTSATFNVWPDPVTRALETIRHLALPISSKIHRALSGYLRRDEGIEDAVQNDWNGSAKVAHLAIAETIAAWETILSAGEAAADAPLRGLIALLERLDSLLGARFPRATEFVRPGFDEPEIAADAPTTQTQFEARQASSGKPSG